MEAGLTKRTSYRFEARSGAGALFGRLGPRGPRTLFLGLSALAALLGPIAVFSSPQDNPSGVRLLNADEEFTSGADNLAAFWVTGWRPFLRTTRLVLRFHEKQRYSRAKYLLGAADSDPACGFLCVNNLLLEKLNPRSPPTPRRTSGEESAGSVSLSSCAYDP